MKLDDLADKIGTFAMNHPAALVLIGSAVGAVIGGLVVYGAAVLPHKTRRGIISVSKFSSSHQVFDPCENWCATAAMGALMVLLAPAFVIGWIVNAGE